MGRYLRHRKGNLFHAAGLGQGEAVPHMDWRSSPEIRQRKRRLAVAAVRGADEIEQSFVFGDRQKLSFAEHPACRGEVACEHPALAYIRLGHPKSSSLDLG